MQNFPSTAEDAHSVLFVFSVVQSCPALCSSQAPLAQLCAPLCNPTDCILPGSSVHGIFQVRVSDGLPFPTPGDLPIQGLNLSLLHLLHWQADSLPLHQLGNPGFLSARFIEV